MSEEKEKYLAILFFLKNYNGGLRNLPGVGEDEEELTEVLKKYQKIVINSSKNILDDLKEILEDCKQKKFERIHFHFSGHGKDGIRVLTSNTEGNNPFDEEDVLKAQTASGECVLGTGVSSHASSIHEIKVELNKMNAEKITITLDCCRTVLREPEEYVVDLGEKKMITPEQHKKMFILHGTMETQPAEDNKGRSFTQILSSVCKANGGAVDILKIDEKVNEKMKAEGMKQRCMAIKEVGNGLWKDYMWPHQLDKTPEAHQPEIKGHVPVNINYGKQGMNCVNASLSNFTINL